ncbi:MAG: hypothetical protein ACREJ2_18205 [Planctomycetota bacterium]
MPTLSHGADQSVGRDFATRAVDDDADNKVSGVYSHLNRQASATMYNELQNEVAALTTWQGRIKIKNSASARSKGDLIYLAGYSAADGAFTFGLAEADAGLPAQFVILDDLAGSAVGFAARAALLTGLNTAAYAAGAALYLSSTAGQTTNAAPSGASEMVQVVGAVEIADATDGAIDFNLQAARKFGSPALQNAAVVANALASDSVTSVKILDGQVTDSKLADASVTTAKIQDANVTAAKLAGAVQGLLPAAVLSVGAEGTPGPDDRQVTVQVQDAGGSNLAANFLLRMWVSTADKGAPAGAQTVTVATGTAIQSVAANQDLWIETDATGKAVLTLNIAGAATLYCMAALSGKVISTPVTFT